jgi:hypothetical protein
MVEEKIDIKMNVISENDTKQEAIAEATSTEPKDASNDEKDNNNDDDEITPESDLSNLNRRIFVVTTASLPWRTGTAVNALSRALYLTRGRPKHYVTLVIPWLPKQEDQAKLFGKNSTFATQDEQEQWIRDYSRDRCGSESK